VDLNIDPFKSIFLFGKNINQFNRFLAILLRFFLGNQIRHREKIEQDSSKVGPEQSLGLFLITNQRVPI